MTVSNMSNALFFLLVFIGLACGVSADYAVSRKLQSLPIDQYMTCPLEAPLDSTISCGTSDLRCSYGTKRCCGKTYESIVCNCDAESPFSCWISTACINPTCGGYTSAPQPTAQTTAEPSLLPTAQATVQPTAWPTAQATSQPTAPATSRPTIRPTPRPSLRPSARPTVRPTVRPTLQSTSQPTVQSTVQDTAQPTVQSIVEGTTVYTSCPLVTPFTSEMKCGDTGLTCSYGTETCCGITHDSVICRCLQGASFRCIFTDACISPTCDEHTSVPTQKPTSTPATTTYNTCPLESPLGSAKKCGSMDLRCSYGTESCCGNIYEALVCNCDAGQLFSCWANDACATSRCVGST